MAVMIGSARLGENGKTTGGAAGDQKQSTAPDKSGEVSQQAFYVHSKGWYVLRPKSDSIAEKLAAAMITACDNKNLGYDQNQRLGVITHGISSAVKTECDCSSLVRACVIVASGKDPGNFTTSNEVSTLTKTGLFEAKQVYTSKLTLYNGDVLVTKTKGHTAVVTQGKSRVVVTKSNYYPKYTGSSSSFVDALKAVGEKETSMAHRDRIAKANGIQYYSGTGTQNLALLKKLKNGELLKG